MPSHLSSVAVILLAACQMPPSSEPALSGDVTAVRDEVMAAQRSYDEALASLDSTRIASSFSPDSNVFVVVGLAAFSRVQLEQWAGSVRPLHRAYSGGSHLDSAKVVVLSPTSAVLTAPNTSVWTDTAGVASTDRGTSTTVWVRTANGWRIAGAHVVWDTPVVRRP